MVIFDSMTGVVAPLPSLLAEDFDEPGSGELGFRKNFNISLTFVTIIPIQQ